MGSGFKLVSLFIFLVCVSIVEGQPAPDRFHLVVLEGIGVVCNPPGIEKVCERRVIDTLSVKGGFNFSLTDWLRVGPYGKLSIVDAFHHPIPRIAGGVEVTVALGHQFEIGLDGGIGYAFGHVESVWIHSGSGMLFPCWQSRLTYDLDLFGRYLPLSWKGWFLEAGVGHFSNGRAAGINFSGEERKAGNIGVSQIFFGAGKKF